MRDPLWRLKMLPWAPLFLAALLTVALATIADILLGIGLVWVFSQLGQSLMPMLQLLMVVLPIAAGFGIGGLALIVMDRAFRHIFLNAGVLWALVACLAVVLFVKSWFPIPTMLVTVGSSQMIGALLGIFVLGKRFWR
jgi:hypothetical protein